MSYMVIEYELVAQIQKWPEEWMTPLEEAGDSETEEEEVETL